MEQSCRLMSVVFLMCVKSSLPREALSAVAIPSCYRTLTAKIASKRRKLSFVCCRKRQCKPGYGRITCPMVDALEDALLSHYVDMDAIAVVCDVLKVEHTIA